MVTASYHRASNTDGRVRDRSIPIRTMQTTLCALVRALPPDYPYRPLLAVLFYILSHRSQTIAAGTTPLATRPRPHTQRPTAAAAAACDPAGCLFFHSSEPDLSTLPSLAHLSIHWLPSCRTEQRANLLPGTTSVPAPSIDKQSVCPLCTPPRSQVATWHLGQRQT